MAELESIELIVLDVDGVLTDGTVLVCDHGVECKRFHVRDGLAIRAAPLVGLKVGALSARPSRATTLRLTELGIDPIVQGAPDKAIGLERVCKLANVLPEQCAYVGDDLLDLPAMVRCAYPIAVGDAVPEVRAEARHVTRAHGGHGAAREAIEHVLKAQGRWEQVLERLAI